LYFADPLDKAFVSGHNKTRKGVKNVIRADDIFEGTAERV
jgi:hypothetical protein